MTKQTTLVTRLISTVAGTAAILIGSGCAQTDITKPKRSAVEELLISRAADSAVGEMDVTALSGKKVYFEEKYVGATDDSDGGYVGDKLYLLGSIRNLISANGGRLVDTAGDAEVIVEARSGALSIDNSESLIGMPAVPIPIPSVGTFETPELPLYKTEKQYSVAKVALFAYDASSRKHLLSSGTTTGLSHHHYYKALGIITWNDTDLPEKSTSSAAD
ncbi:MAG: hypothetical protein P8J87_15630 [Verrucomicrobiales bacterium]|nr:hypothetical protein [Verrucomicrobiales bacterium]